MKILKWKNYPMTLDISKKQWRSTGGWAGFEPVGGIEKKNWADYEQLLRAVFSCFHGQKKSKFKVFMDCQLERMFP